MSLPYLDIGSVIALVGLAIAVLKLYLEHRKSKKDLRLAKEYIRILSNLVESYKKDVESKQQLKRQKLEWNKLKTLGKSLWEVFKYSEEEQS